MMQQFKRLNRVQKSNIASVFLVSALITMIFARIHILKDGDFDFTILGWIKVHLWSIIPAFVSVWILKWTKLELIEGNFIVKGLLNWFLTIVATILIELSFVLIFYLFILLMYSF